ncbi:hypothetical protein L9F63_007472, partial [Diploptera punctata]
EDGHAQERCWTDSFVEMLRHTRAAPPISSRGKRINIITGKIVGLQDLLQKESRSKEISDSSSLSSTSEEEEDGNSNDAVCLVCKKLWSRSKSGEDWVECQICHAWAHEICAEYPKKQYNTSVVTVQNSETLQMKEHLTYFLF